MIFTILSSLLFLQISGQCFDKRRQIVFNASDDEPVTIRTPDYPEFYDQRANCEWTFEASPAHSLSLTILNFETDYEYDYVKIYERLTLNEKNVLLPIQKLTHQSQDNENANFYGRAFQIVLYSSFYNDEGFKFQLIVRQETAQQARQRNCGLDRVVNVTDSLKKISSTFQEEMESDECSVIFVAPPKKSIQFSSSDCSSNDCKWILGKKYRLLEMTSSLIDNLALVNERPICDNGPEKSIYAYLLALATSQSYHNIVLLQLCRRSQNSLEFSVQTHPDRCVCIWPKITLTFDTGILMPGIPIGACDLVPCESEVTAVENNNETHYERVRLESGFILDSFGFVIEMKGFETNGSAIMTSSSRAFHSMSPVWTLPTSFVIKYHRNLHEINFTLIHVPKECKCFPDTTDAFLILMESFENKQLLFDIGEDCPQLDCFIKIRNDPKRHLSITWASDDKNFSKQWSLIFAMDQEIKSSFRPGNSYVRKFATDDYPTPKKPVNFIYLHFVSNPSVLVSKKAWNVNVTMQWKEAITCGQSEFSLDEKPIFISSPGFPKIYPKSMNCSYLIKAPEGAKIRFKVMVRSMSYYDRLTFEEHEVIYSIDSTSEIRMTEHNEVLFRFVSFTGYSAPYRGFQIKLESYWINGKPTSHTGTYISLAMTDSIQNLPPPPAYDEIDKTTEYFPAGPGGARFQQNQFHPPPPFDPPSNVSTQVIILEHRAITEPDYLTPRQKLILIILMFIPITWPFLGILLMILACKGDQNGKFMRRPFIHGLFLINLTLVLVAIVVFSVVSS
ncbi:unnamed protein product, partial [Mesorhabditis belari]|uniref:CUB domain-containing protein n=1 Tax=Mesorhabditis belari TaxID=2138241 RepID=A0AAF3EMR8_9BILA